MVWGKRIYGLVDFASGQVPEWAEQERIDEIARVRDWQKRRRSEFLHALRVRFGSVERPADIAAARVLIEGLQAEGVMPRYPLEGDLWLARRLAQVGVVLPAQRAVCAPADALFDDWARDCLRVSTDSPCPLEDLADSLHRWLKWRDRLNEMPSSRRLAAWLRSKGHQSARHGSGIVFRGIVYCRPRSLGNATRAPANPEEARIPAQTNEGADQQ